MHGSLYRYLWFLIIIVAAIKMHMCRYMYKRTCRPGTLSMQAMFLLRSNVATTVQDSLSRYDDNNYLASCFVRGLAVQLVCAMAMFSLCSNVDTTVPDSLNRYGKEQLPSLSQSKRLGGPACERGSCSVGSWPSP